jgi:hypothetical protein
VHSGPGATALVVLSMISLALLASGIGGATANIVAKADFKMTTPLS